VSLGKTGDPQNKYDPKISGQLSSTETKIQQVFQYPDNQCFWRSEGSVTSEKIMPMLVGKLEISSKHKWLWDTSKNQGFLSVLVNTIHQTAPF